MKQHLSIAKKQCQRGITLVEVLISILVISFAVLGAAALQIVSLKNSLSMEHRAQATFLANDMLERMRAGKRFGLEKYNMPNSNKPPSVAGVVGSDLKEWGTSVKTLPNGQASVEVSADGFVELTFNWTQRSPYAKKNVEKMIFVIEAKI